MKPEDLDPTYVLAFLMFCAAVAAGAELSQMTKPKWSDQRSKFRPDQKGAALALAVVLIVLFIMYACGGPAPMPD